MTVEHVDAQGRLRAIVAAFPGQRFAVVDGGHFKDLPARFKRERLFARSLFLDQVDIEVQKAGPWLVALDQSPEARDRTFAVVGEKPAAVFWCCDAGEAVLHRHLRSLNMARIPAWAVTSNERPPQSTDVSGFSTVFFRHFDPRVLSALLPALEAAQFSRLLGPAQEIAFFSEAFGGTRRAVHDSGWPPAQPGHLVIRSEQIDLLTQRRETASKDRIIKYLRRVAQEKTDGMSSPELQDHVDNADQIGRALGLESERAHSKWAYLMLSSDNRIADAPGVAAYLRSEGGHPDKKLDTFVDSIFVASKRLGDNR